MRLLCVCPMDDTIDICCFELYNEQRIHGLIQFQTYTPEEPPLFPYVPAYFQQYNYQRAPLRKFLREKTAMGMRSRDFLLALHDDATDLEAHALSELLINCGAKSTLVEYRAFLLSSEDAYIAVTGSKRAVTVTRVLAAKDDTERIFVPIAEATPEAVRECVRDLNPDNALPVYRFGLGENMETIGEAVNHNEILRNFVKIRKSQI